MSAVDAAALTAWVREFARLVHEQRDALTRLDAAIGDADHGANLDRGMTAAVAALEAQPADDPATVLKTVATTLIKTVGGASGPLYGTFFLRAAGALDGDDAAAADLLDVDGGHLDVVDAAVHPVDGQTHAVTQLVARGGARRHRP